jgi:ribosomal protein L11 methyltransferase
LSPTYQITLSFTADLNFDQVGLFVSALDDIALSSSYREEGRAWACLWTTDDAPDIDDIRARLLLTIDMHDLPVIDLTSLDIEELPDINWLEASYAGFQPFALGPFFIYGSHSRGSITPPREVLTLEIDAATAFGSGEHGTTAGCLLAMNKLRAQGFNPVTCLDMGTGSGILAIAAAKLWPGMKAWAVDNDPECIVVTERHRDFNHITQDQLVSFVSEGFTDPRVEKPAPYDLVIANILASPLIDMAANLSAATAKNGYLILSGLLIEQQEAVLAAYTQHRMTLIEGTTRDEWAILTLAHTL